MSEEVKEGPYTDNGMKLTDFKYQMFGPGIPKGMLHLQLATLCPADQVLLLLNFGFEQGRYSRDAEVAELKQTIETLTAGFNEQGKVTIQNLVDERNDRRKEATDG